jgi:GNAT superfamily N-acetyltransferase
MSAKAKKLARKAETALANEHAATVKAAEALSDPLASLPAAARVFALDAGTATPSTQIRLVSSSASTLSPNLLDAAHAMCRANMEELYAPVWGAWDEAKKRRQLSDEPSRFLLAFASSPSSSSSTTTEPKPPKREVDSASPEDQGANTHNDDDNSKNLVALVNYRFEMDDGGGTGRGPSLPVAYCYELQLLPEVQRKGLGKKLMRALEMAAARAGMRAVVLTVLDANVGARALYATLGYGLDPNSPDPDDPEEAHAGYRILRKDFPEAVVKAAAAARAAAGGVKAAATTATAAATTAASK